MFHNILHIYNCDKHINNKSTNKLKTIQIIFIILFTFVQCQKTEDIIVDRFPYIGDDNIITVENMESKLFTMDTTFITTFSCLVCDTIDNNYPPSMIATGLSWDNNDVSTIGLFTWQAHEYWVICPDKLTFRGKEMFLYTDGDGYLSDFVYTTPDSIHIDTIFRYDIFPGHFLTDSVKTVYKFRNVNANSPILIEFDSFTLIR